MPTDHPGWSEPTLGFLVHDVARLLRKRLEQQARAADIGLTRAQWQVLANIARCEGHQPGLPRRLSSTSSPLPSSGCSIAWRGWGWSSAGSTRSDRRQRNLYLTDQAWPELERVRELGRPCARRR